MNRLPITVLLVSMAAVLVVCKNGGAHSPADRYSHPCARNCCAGCSCKRYASADSRPDCYLLANGCLDRYVLANRRANSSPDRDSSADG